MKKIVLKKLGIVLAPFKSIIVGLIEIEAFLSSRWASGSHHRLFLATWGIPKNPESFDHNLDLYYFWRKTRNAHWLERGAFNSLVLKPNGSMLEIACGDGFNARNFYSSIASEIVACDFDKDAISLAKRKNSNRNIRYVVADVRNNMPEGNFNNVICDMALEHFTTHEIESIMPAIKNRLVENKGVFSGVTIVEREDGKKSLEQHEYEFKDMQDLKRFLSPYFSNVIVFETIYPSRHNLYFWASDFNLPFSPEWPHCLMD